MRAETYMLTAIFFLRNISRMALIGQELNLKTTRIALVFLKR